MHINPDHFLETDAGRVITPERNKDAWKRCFEALDVALQGATSDTKVFVMVGPQGAGKSSWVRNNKRGNYDAIFFDAILVKRSERKPIIDAAKAHGVQVIAVWLKTPLEMCIARNASRPCEELVDDRAIRNVYAAIEPPGLGEGFAKVIEVG
jgi:shikimate kinase